MVVLHELLLGRDPKLGVPLSPVGLGEEAPLVAVHVGLDHDEAGEACGDGSHGGGDYRSPGLPPLMVGVRLAVMLALDHASAMVERDGLPRNVPLLVVGEERKHVLARGEVLGALPVDRS